MFFNNKIIVPFFKKIIISIKDTVNIRIIRPFSEYNDYIHIVQYLNISPVCSLTTSIQILNVSLSDDT